MNVDEYYKEQEKLKRLFAQSLAERDKENILRQMLKTEMEFIVENLEPIPEINTELNGSPLNLVDTGAKRRVEAKDCLFIQSEKLTPENFFSRVKISGNKDLPKELANNPKFIQKLCDMFNAAALGLIENQIGDDINQYEKFDDGKSIGYRKDPTKIADKGKEADAILGRAKKLQSKMAKPDTSNKIENSQKNNDRASSQRLQ